MWKNTVQQDRQQMTMRFMRIERWISKVTNTRSEYVIFTAFPMQQLLHECASVLSTLPFLLI
jgi:hypothetical protein